MQSKCLARGLALLPAISVLACGGATPSSSEAGGSNGITTSSAIGGAPTSNGVASGGAATSGGAPNRSSVTDPARGGSLHVGGVGGNATSIGDGGVSGIATSIGNGGVSGIASSIGNGGIGNTMGSNPASGTSARGGSAGTRNGGGAAGRGGASTTSGTTSRGGANDLGTTGGLGQGGTGIGSNPTGGGAGFAASTGIKVQGKQLLVDGKPFRIRGVCWNPVPKGKNHPDGIDFEGLAPRDIPLMQAANINAVRTYEPLTNTAVLDQLANAGIYVLNSVYPYGGDAANVVTARVNAVKSHRAILIWVIGNEWNYNGLYVDMTAAAAQTRLNEVATLIRAADPNHPIASVYGEVPTKALVDAMPNVDVWGINAYRGLSFGDLFSKWSGVSSKPMFLSEFGADAYNATKGAYDPASQAAATEALTREIAAQSTDLNANGTVLGGTIFEWADEWWKDSSGNLNAQDVGGVAPGGGPYPDSTFNEEWWGIVDIDRKPRPAYDALKTVYGGG